MIFPLNFFYSKNRSTDIVRSDTIVVVNIIVLAMFKSNLYSVISVNTIIPDGIADCINATFISSPLSPISSIIQNAMHGYIINFSMDPSPAKFI